VPFKGHPFPESQVCLMGVLVYAYTNKLKGSSSISPNQVNSFSWGKKPKTFKKFYSFRHCVIMDLFVGFCYIVLNENM